MAKLIYASTHNRDVLYAVRKNILDPFFLLDHGGSKYIFLDSREFGRIGRVENPELKEVRWDDLVKKAADLPDAGSLINKIAWIILSEYGLLDQEVEVPNDMPLDMADYLRSKGLDLKIIAEMYVERQVKSPAEIEHIAENLRATGQVFQLLEDVLRQSAIKRDHLEYKGAPLTSETLKRKANMMLAELGMVDLEGMIISSGIDTAIPHHNGAGLIRPHLPIVCDIFPYSRDNLYSADMTRTYIKGEPKAEWVKMYQTVLSAQELALSLISPRVSGREVHMAVEKFIIEAGYDTGEQGFTHGTGHGLGLAVHERPSLNRSNDRLLAPGNVLTVEPGLYYRKWGGARIEDVVAVTETGCENLTDHHKEYLIA